MAILFNVESREDLDGSKQIYLGETMVELHAVFHLSVAKSYPT